MSFNCKSKNNKKYQINWIFVKGAYVPVAVVCGQRLSSNLKKKPPIKPLNIITFDINRDINIIAKSPNTRLSFPCNDETTICPEGMNNCCGFYGNLEYEGYGENNLIAYQSISSGSRLSFNREYLKYNLTSELTASDNLVELINGSTTGMSPGQLLIKKSGNGSFQEKTTILSIISENRFLTSKNHTTSGMVTFNIPNNTDEPNILELRLSDGSYYGIITNSYKNYSGNFEIYDGKIKYTGSFVPDFGKDYSTINIS